MITDEEGNKVDITKVTEENSAALFEKIEEVIIELKKINMHLQSITNEKIGEDDIECQ